MQCIYYYKKHENIYTNSTLILIFCLFIFFYFAEISKVRASLFQINGVRKEPLELPEPDGQTLTMNEKVYVPVKEHPDVSMNLNWIYVIFICYLRHTSKLL